MPDETSPRCSRCGNTDSVEARFAACVATTQYAKNNYPAPNSWFTTNDDIRLWPIHLCKTCLPNSYQLFLRNRLKKAGTQLAICTFLLILAALAIYFKIPGPSTLKGLDDPLRWLVATAIAVAAFAGGIGVPVCLVMLAVNLGRLKRLERTGVVPEKRLDKSFIGEGQRIIASLGPRLKPGTIREKVWGEFSLPEHKRRNQLNISAKEMEKLSAGDHQRDIIAVGTTVKEMEQRLPQEWKALWETHKNSSTAEH